MLTHRIMTFSEAKREFSEQWDDLVSLNEIDSIYSSFQWAEATSQSDKVEQNVLVVFQESLLVGGLLFDVVEEKFPDHYKIESFLNGYNPFFSDSPNFNIPSTGNPSIAICNRGAKSCDIRFDKDLTVNQKNTVARYIVKVLKEYSEELKCPFLSFLYIPSSMNNNFLYNILDSEGFCKFLVGASYSIPINFRNIDEYLERFTSKRRNSIRSEIKKAVSSGVNYEYVPLSGNESELAKTVLFNFLKYEYPNYNIDRYTERLSYISGSFENDAYICRMRVGGQIIGEVLLLSYKNNLIARVVGIEPGYEKLFPYFNLVYYNLIEHSLEKGYERVIFGDGLDATKMSRGCLQDKLYMYVYTENNLQENFDLINRFVESQEVFQN